MSYDISGLQKVSGGNTDFEKKMIQMFVDQLPSLLEKLELALQQKAYESFGITAHSMKPSVDMLCEESLRQLVRVLEEKGKEKTGTDTLEGEFALFKEKMLQVSAELQSDYLG